jgi:hypothetical protein
MSELTVNGYARRSLRPLAAVDGLRVCYCGSPERLERLLELLDLLRQPKSIQELEVARA